jgi:hypothetical protein
MCSLVRIMHQKLHRLLQWRRRPDNFFDVLAGSTFSISNATGDSPLLLARSPPSSVVNWETVVTLYQAVRCHISEDRNLKHKTEQKRRPLTPGPLCNLCVATKDWRLYAIKRVPNAELNSSVSPPSAFIHHLHGLNLGLSGLVSDDWLRPDQGCPTRDEPGCVTRPAAISVNYTDSTGWGNFRSSLLKAHWSTAFIKIYSM